MSLDAIETESASRAHGGASSTYDLAFTKLHGLGNDYVFVDGFDVPVIEAPGLARMVSDRHRGVGGDGLILLLPPRGDGDVRMRMFNADGSEAEMCGNGIRCLVRLAIAHGRAEGFPVRVETGAGVLECRGADDDAGRGDHAGEPTEVEVDMGPPRLELAEVPVDEAWLGPAGGARRTIECDGVTFTASFCSMGNPHAVIEVPDAAALERFDLERFGPLLERHPAFPARMNVHVVAALAADHLRMRTWERGSGITEACGTGACAVLVTMARDGRAAVDAAVDLPGGRLRIRWDRAADRVAMTGPAEMAFTGTVLVPRRFIG